MTKVFCDKCNRPESKTLVMHKFGYDIIPVVGFNPATIITAGIVFDICDDCITSYKQDFLKNLTANPIT